MRSKKTKMKNVTKWLAASAVFSLVSLASQRADAVLQMQYTAPSSQYLVGTVVPGLQGQGGGQAVRDAAMTNTLIGMAVGAQPAGSPLYSRSFNSFGSLPPATATGAVAVTGLSGGTGNVFINLNVTGTFQYLVAAYDGPNGGVAVWNISSLTGTIEIYGFAKPEKVNGHLTGNLLGSDHAQRGYFRITSYTLLNPLSVPDSGATVMLLGAALGALGMARRYLSS
jgi:VPDSG-CTERM motif